MNKKETPTIINKNNHNDIDITQTEIPKPSKIAVLIESLNPITILSRIHNKWLVAERDYLLEKMNNIEFATEDEFNQFKKEMPFNELHKNSKKIIDSFQKEQKVQDMRYKGDLSMSGAYLAYYQCYESIYDNWVKKKRQDELKQTKTSKELMGSRKEQNITKGKNITENDYSDLYNVMQSAYTLMLINHKEISIKCEIDTMLIVSLIDRKMLDYTFTNILSIVKKHPVTPVALEFVMYSDNSVMLRIRADGEKGKEVFDDILYFINNKKDEFKNFLANNHVLIQSLNDELKEAGEKIENSLAKSQEENLAIATFSYVNNYNILLEEFKRGVVMGTQDLRTVLMAIEKIHSVALQNKSKLYFERDKKTIEAIRAAQEKKDQENNHIGEAETLHLDNELQNNSQKQIDDNHESDIPKSNLIKIGGSKNNYQLYQNINTTDELLKLIMKTRTYTTIRERVNKNKSYVSKQNKIERIMREALSVNIINEDKLLQENLSNQTSQTPTNDD